MAVRLPRGSVEASRLRSPGGRLLQADLTRLRRRVAAGKPITLYRGERVRTTRGGGGMRRLRRVTRGQSWTLTPHLALEYASQLSRKKGSAGLLYSITVPASEMRGALAAKQVKTFYEHSASGSAARSGSGGWTPVQDPGAYTSKSKQAMRLELKSDRDRPDLRPRIVGTAVRINDGEWGTNFLQTIRYGFTRRLGRSRHRRGTPVRGGGA